VSPVQAKSNLTGYTGCPHQAQETAAFSDSKNGGTVCDVNFGAAHRSNLIRLGEKQCVFAYGYAEGAGAWSKRTTSEPPMSPNDQHRKFPAARDDIDRADHVPVTPQTQAPAYALAFADESFLCRDELRPVRLQLELLKPEMLMEEEGVKSTVVLFGGARIPDPAHKDSARTKTLADLSAYYDEARVFAQMMTKRSLETGGTEDVIVTGGGPGVMEAGNRGAQDVGGRSIGLNIVLPHEQAPNSYVTPELCFNFHYFAIRTMHFLMRARAIAVFPGGFGTLDELFEALTLIQTGRMEKVPILLFGPEFWNSILNFDALSDAGTISADDLELFRMVSTAQEAMDVIDNWEGKGARRGTIPGR
jgi:uncharacterized protein (TIGR00730 family)